jgi:hypothetical protein
MPEQQSIRDFAEASVALMHDHARDPERHGNSLGYALRYDLRWLCYLRSTLNVQRTLGSWPACSPTGTWKPLWLGDQLESLRTRLDATIYIFREETMITPPRTSMEVRRRHILETLFQVARSLSVGLTWDEGFEILEAWLRSKGRDPRLYYCTLLGAVERRLNRKRPSTKC